MHAGERVDRADRPGLAEAVAFDQGAPRHFLEAALYRGGQGRTARNAETQARKIIPAGIARGVQRRIHGRNADEYARPFPVDGGQHLRRFETGQQDQFGADGEAQIHHPRHAEGVEQGKHPENLFGTASHVRRPHGDLVGIDVQVRMGQARALGKAGGAAGVLQHGHVTGGVDVDRLHLPPVFDQPFEGDVPVIVRDGGDLMAPQKGEQRLFQERQRARHAADDDLLDPARRFQEGGRLSIERLDVQGDQDAGP